MATKIVTKNSSTASAVPTASDLVQGELAVNVADKRLFTENNAGAIVELGTNPSGNVTFQDNGKAIFGAGSDLQIYHDGGNSWVKDNGDGVLALASNGNGVGLYNADGTKPMLFGTVDADVKIYHDGNLKLATTATGIDVTGTVTSTSYGSQLATTLFEQNVLKSSVTASSGAFVRMAVSSASNPTYAFEDDTDTGVFTSGANTLNFGTAGTERMRIDSAGNVAIGTSNSLGVLTIKAPASDDQDIITITEDGINQAFSINGNFAGAGSTGNSITLDSYWVDDIISFRGDGNVGIGASASSYKADILATNQYALRLNTTDADGCFLAIQTNGTAKGYLGSSHHLVAGTPSENDITLRAENNLQFTTGGGAERMRINSDGKVDVGAISNQTVAVLNARFNGAAIEFGHGNNGAGYYGTAGSYGNNGQPYIGFSCYSQENLNLFTTNGAKGNIITGDLSGNLTFAQITNANAVDQSPTNRMTLDNAGNLLVGETSSNPYNNLTTAHVFKGASSTGGAAPFGIYSSTGTANVPVLSLLSRDTSTDTSSRFMQFFANVTSTTNTPMGGIVGNGANNVQFVSLSDVRDKENITTISGSLSKINNLNPVEFDWIASGEHCKAGFVAQEVKEVFPEFVVENVASEGQEERKGLTGGMTGGIVAHLVKAIQEQQTLIESLTDRIAALEE